MHVETPVTTEVDQTPFDANGVFDLELASSIVLELRASGHLQAADDLEQMATFFRTSEHYINAYGLPLHNMPPSPTNNSNLTISAT